MDNVTKTMLRNTGSTYVRRFSGSNPDEVRGAAELTKSLLDPYRSPSLGRLMLDETSPTGPYYIDLTYYGLD